MQKREAFKKTHWFSHLLMPGNLSWIGSNFQTSFSLHNLNVIALCNLVNDSCYFEGFHNPMKVLVHAIGRKLYVSLFERGKKKKERKENPTGSWQH